MVGPEDQGKGQHSNQTTHLNTHSFMTGPEDQGSYLLIVRHYFRAGPEDQRTEIQILIFFKTVTLLRQDQRTRAHMF